MFQHVLVKSVVVHLNVLVKHVAVVRPNAPVFRYVPAKNAVVFLRVLVYLAVHVFQYAHAFPDALAMASLVALHYARVVVSHAWAYVIVTANPVDYVVVLVYQLVLVAVAHLVRARVSDTHHRVLATVVQYVVQ